MVFVQCGISQFGQGLKRFGGCLENGMYELLQLNIF